jgi:dTDP-4-dehydrorhamnose reductase
MDNSTPNISNTMKILILGHKGMLGSMIHKYYKYNNIDTEITSFKWDSCYFKNFIKNSKCNYLINCIGAVPQKNPNWERLKFINFLLPDWLAKNFNGYILHPTSNGEFSGLLKKGEFYKKYDYKNADNEYGISKAISSLVLFNYLNVKQIRSSIVGPELNSNFFLMEWFFNQDKYVNGYTNHLWNGITTLEWAKQSLKIIKNWDFYDNVVQIGTNQISKYDLLVEINKMFNCNKIIIPTISHYDDNKCLISDYKIKNIKLQLKELKVFIKKEYDKR